MLCKLNGALTGTPKLWHYVVVTIFSDNEWGVEIETPKKDFHFRFVVDGARMLSKAYKSEDTDNGPLNLYESWIGLHATTILQYNI